MKSINLLYEYALLKNRVSTSVIKDFQHRLLIDVESTEIKSIIINIDFPKINVNMKLQHRLFK